MLEITISQINSIKENGFSLFNNFINDTHFINITNELTNLINATYSGNKAPLRTWWMQDELHFKKIDQVHHCSHLLLNIIKQGNFESFLPFLFEDNEVIQVWSSSLYICPPEKIGASSAIGLHCDKQFTPFIEGDYYAALLPLNEVNYSNIVISENSFSHDVDYDLCDPLAQNLTEQIANIKLKHDVIFSKINVTAGDVLFTHSRCLKGILTNTSEHSCSYLVIYFRSENNKKINRINHFGMCDYLHDLTLSPIIWHRKLNVAD